MKNLQPDIAKVENEYKSKLALLPPIVDKSPWYYSEYSGICQHQPYSNNTISIRLYGQIELQKTFKTIAEFTAVAAKVEAMLQSALWTELVALIKEFERLTKKWDNIKYQIGIELAEQLNSNTKEYNDFEFTYHNNINYRVTKFTKNYVHYQSEYGRLEKMSKKEFVDYVLLKDAPTLRKMIRIINIRDVLNED